MATRIIRLTATVGTSETNLGEVAPPAGIKWTVVELRPYHPGGTNYVIYRAYFDTELYYEIDSRITPAQYSRPHIVGIDVAQPHTLRLTAQASAANQTAMIEIVLEEAPLGA